MIWFLFSLSIILLSCKTTNERVIIGGDKDKYGCKGSAGYQWSEMKRGCIRSFELPLQLYNNDKSFSAGVLFNSDSSKAEVFSKEGRFILNKTEEGIFMDNRNEFKLEIHKNQFEFFDLIHSILYQN